MKLLVNPTTLAEAINKPEEKEVPKNTLMGPPKKQMTKTKEDDILSPSRRAASYIEMLRKKREEIINA